MTATPPPDPYREWDAAYVLGALSPRDRRAFEQHLATCAACREAVAELAGMPASSPTASRHAGHVARCCSNARRSRGLSAPRT